MVSRAYVSSPPSPQRAANMAEISAVSAELKRLQADMDTVSYVASHDLLAPLRIIISTCETAEDAASETVRTIHQEALRMKGLMEGMLEYTRMESFRPTLKPVELNEALSDAMDTLENEIARSGAQISADALPQVIGHRGRLTRLFAYLLDNAIKFSTGSAPRVRLTVQTAGDEWKFCVADEGIGVDAEHREIIFRLFQRLHTAEDYPGLGIGLALAQKIVESHGGTIWVEENEPAGTRVCFTLPASPQNKE